MIELIIEGQLADLSEDIAADITYSLADIRTPDKRQVNYTKTIALEGTAQNNYIFGFIYNIDVQNAIAVGARNVGINYNPKKLASVQLIVDGVQVFDGTLRLWSVVTKGPSVTYQTSLFGKLFDIFSALGDSKLNDIDFSEFNHAYTWANIIATWQTSYAGAFIYPTIDLGNNIVGVSGKPDSFKFGGLVPCYRYSVLLDKIFNSISAGYDLNFSDLTIFNKILVTPPLATITGSPNFFTSSRDTVQAHNILEPDRGDGGGKIYGAILGNVVSHNAIGAYDDYVISHDIIHIEGYKFVLNQNISTSFQYILDFSLSMDSSYTGWTVPNNHPVLEIIHYNGADDTVNETWTGSAFWNPIADPTSMQIVVEVPTHDFLDNDYIVVNISDLTQGVNLTINPNSSIKAVSPIDQTEYPLVEGDIYDMNKAVPVIGMVDFIKDFIKLFNLYVTQDPEDSSITAFTPQVDFYKRVKANSIDWTYKIDYDEEITFTPISQLTAKQYVLTWKQDKDYWTDKYFNDNKEIYGQVTYISDTDVLTNTETIEMLFSPAVMTRFAGSSVICPAIYKVETVDGLLTKSADKFNSRLLIWGGLLAAGHTITLLDSDGISYTTTTNYPYAGHLNNPKTPTYDLNFGNTNTNLPTSSVNQFSKYWGAGLQESASKDSRLVACTMYLKPEDVERLDFSALYKAADQLYRLNKIEGFNPFELGTCKVELIKVINL